MKRFLLFSLFLPLFFACNNRNGNCDDYPEIADAAYGYLDAVANFRFDDAIPYASPQTQANTIPFFINMLNFVHPDSIAAKLPAEVTLYNVIPVNDTSARVVYRKADKRVDHTDTLDMVLVDGKWTAEVLIAVPPIISAILDSSINKSIPRTEQERDSMKRARFQQIAGR